MSHATLSAAIETTTAPANSAQPSNATASARSGCRVILAWAPRPNARASTRRVAIAESASINTIATSQPTNGAATSNAVGENGGSAEDGSTFLLIAAGLSETGGGPAESRPASR